MGIPYRKIIKLSIYIESTFILHQYYNINYLNLYNDMHYNNIINIYVL